MQRRLLMLVLCSFSTVAPAQNDLRSATQQLLGQFATQAETSNTLDLSQSELVIGIQEALAKGTTSAINVLGKTDGYWDDAQVRIPLPSSLQRAETALNSIGQGQKLEEFQLALNRAAEAAIPQVADVFGNSIRQMSVADARSIINGDEDAATQYFRQTSGDALFEKVRPIVASMTEKVGVTQKFKNLSNNLGPLMQLAGGPAEVDLDDYVTQLALDGLFLKIAEEEKSIRENPAERTTDILRQVFGG